MAEPILKNSVAVGESRLVDQFQDKPNILGVLNAFLKEGTQVVEDLAFEVNTAFDKDTAIGVQLDTIGKIVGESRGGKADEAYRDAINGQIDANTANGTIDNITDIVKRSLPDSVDYFSAVNLMPDPYNPAGWFGSTTDVDGTITNTDLLNPSGQSFIGLVEQTGTGFLRPASTELAPITAVEGDTFYVSLVCKNVNKDSNLLFFIGSDQINKSLSINIATGAVNQISSDSVSNYQVLDDGFVLIQFSYTFLLDVTGLVGRVSLLDESGTTTEAEIGTQILAQAAFFGRTGKSLGTITYTDGLNAYPYGDYPASWFGGSLDFINGTIVNTLIDNPSGEKFVGLATQTGGVFDIASNRNLFGNTAAPFATATGDKLYSSLIARTTSFGPIRLLMSFYDSGNVVISEQIVDVDTGATAGEIRVTNLTNGFKLFEFEHTVVGLGDTGTYTRVTLWDATLNQAAPVGAQVYVQSSFVGIAPDFPSIITLPDTNLLPATVTQAANKSVVVFEHPPADIHVFVDSPESQAISDSLNEITSVGVRRTMAFLPESSLALIPQELNIVRSFLVVKDNLGNLDQLVVQDGGPNNLVVATIEGSFETDSSGYLAELIPEDGDRVNVAYETLRTS